MSLLKQQVKINKLFASAVNKSTSPMQWIESVDDNEVVAFLRAADYQDFCFTLTLNDDDGLLTVTDYTLEDEPVALTTSQIEHAQNRIQWLYDGSQTSEAYETDHGLRNSDFISVYA